MSRHQCELCGYEPAPFLTPETDPPLVEHKGARVCVECMKTLEEDTDAGS